MLEFCRGGYFDTFKLQTLKREPLLSNKVLDENRGMVRPVYSLGLNHTLFWLSDCRSILVSW